VSLILVVDDESDVEMLFRQQFRRDLRAGRFRMDFALSADSAQIWTKCNSQIRQPSSPRFPGSNRALNY
jgi:hypothetical protein